MALKGVVSYLGDPEENTRTSLGSIIFRVEAAETWWLPTCRGNVLMTKGLGAVGRVPV